MDKCLYKDFREMQFGLLTMIDIDSQIRNEIRRFCPYYYENSDCGYSGVCRYKQEENEERR